MESMYSAAAMEEGPTQARYCAYCGKLVSKTFCSGSGCDSKLKSQLMWQVDAHCDLDAARRLVAWGFWTAEQALARLLKAFERLMMWSGYRRGPISVVCTLERSPSAAASNPDAKRDLSAGPSSLQLPLLSLDVLESEDEMEEAS